MRPIYFTLPLGLLLMSAGALMWLKSHPPVPMTDPEPKHPVTTQMREDTEAKSKKSAPAFELVDSKGEKRSLAELSKDKPVFLYFIKDGCPCSIEVEPLFHELYKQHGDKVNFVGIIGSDQKVAAKWVENFKTPYTVLADPDELAISAYEAPSSAYSALVYDGKIQKMWPGYSKPILLQIHVSMVNATGVKLTDFDTQYAPLKDSTGCSFDWVAKKPAAKKSE